MKKKTMIALLTAASLLVSCSKTAPTETTTEGTTTEATTAEETTAVSETSETTETTPAPSPTPEPTPVPTPPGDIRTEGPEQYDMFMAKIDEIEASAPGQYGYQFSVERNSCILTAFDGNDKIRFVITDGEMTEYVPEEEHSYVIDYYLSYEDIRSIPFLCDTRLSVDTLGEERVEFNSPVTDVVESVPDGIYFGSLVGFSSDGTSALVVAGTPISFDRDEILSLEVEAPIGFMDFTVADIIVNEEYDYVQIDLSSESYDIGNLHLTNNRDADNSRLYLCEESNAWMLEGCVIVQVPVSSSVELGGNYENMLYGPDGYEPEDPVITGNPLLDSGFWAALDPSYCSNGWLSCSGGLEPVVIENGQITYMAIGYR